MVAHSSSEHILIEDLLTTAEVLALRRRYFREPYPATTAVIVAGLANPEWMVEIEATAVLA